MPQETCPDNFQVKVSSACQFVCQVTSQLSSREGTQLKCQRNFQFPIQVPHQWVYQIDPIRYPRGFPRDMPSIIPFIPVFSGSFALVLNIKTGVFSSQLHIVFDDDFTKTSARITNKLRKNWDNLFNKHHELTSEEFQFSVGKQWKTPTDRSEGDHKINNNSC